jgi:multisubunit Na+/H+ antiporter MnhE subunit
MTKIPVWRRGGAVIAVCAAVFAALGLLMRGTVTWRDLVLGLVTGAVVQYFVRHR